MYTRNISRKVYSKTDQTKVIMDSLEKIGLEILPLNNDVVQQAVPIMIYDNVNIFNAYLFAWALKLNYPIITADPEQFDLFKTHPNVYFLHDII